MEDAKIQRQHRQHEDVEQNPEDPIGGHRKCELAILNGGTVFGLKRRIAAAGRPHKLHAHHTIEASDPHLASEPG
jgi:hypothetical protein